MQHIFLEIFIISLGILADLVLSKTDSQDVSALNVMFTSLNSPSKLSGWEQNGGDPCDDSWQGITCSDSSVTQIDLAGLGLSDSLGYQLGNLKSVIYFDMSNNKLQNDIPYQLPPNTAHLDLSNNGFTGTLPYSISQMNDLQYLNVANNKLNGQLSDMFQKLPKLKTLDLSKNSLTGNLPQSFSSLSSLKTLLLQNNQFTGPINVLADLPLETVNVKNNKFTGWVPKELEGISSLETGGNSWSSGQAPPPPPGAKPSKHKKSGDGEGGMSWITIALIALASLVVFALLIILVSSRRSSPSSHFLDEERASRHRAFTPLTSQELFHDSDTTNHKEFSEFPKHGSIDMKSMQKSPSIGYNPPYSDFSQSVNENEFATRLNARTTSFRAVPCSLSDLLVATGNFSMARLLGEGSIGRVYRAKYPDGKVLAVKKIDSSLFQGAEPEEFSGIVSSISKVHHPNIAELVGHCSEQGHNMLIYEYFRNGSLHDFLHVSDDYSKPLTWNTRVKIALGTAQAVEYLHEVCSPPFIHKNIKSSNILLDLELNPHLSDYGLANFYNRTSQNLGPGYNAPECTKSSAYTMKSDIYSFGVVMLELLSGRKPVDNSKPKSEQCLVRWATPQLHDIDALANMVDPALRGLYPPKSVSRFADIIALCVQAEPEFRPPMSEVVQSLVRLVQRSSMNLRDDLVASYRT